MARTTIPVSVQSAIWARAAGCCQYRHCKENLVGDLISGREDGTFGFIAHIVADNERGPRGHPKLSLSLAKDLGNLMLLCARHHKLIDVKAVEAHPVSLLAEMKAEHEARVERNVAIVPDRESHVIRFAASIGQNEVLISTRDIHAAMVPDRYPATRETIDLEMINSTFRDDEADYWRLERENLRRAFDRKVRGRIERQEIRHVSVFALAPQPLLIELGRLLGDILPAMIHQRHREPATWAWQADQRPIEYVSAEAGAAATGPVALKLGISATVTDDRIYSVLGDDAAIWSITALEPHNDILRRAEDQAEFRRRLRRMLDLIKARHGQFTPIHVFAVMPASLAVEVGRVWMPKADAPLKLYDNRAGEGFVFAFGIGGHDTDATDIAA